MSNYMSIRKIAKQDGIPERILRNMLKEGELPGFYSGNRFVVNHDMLVEILNDKSKASVTKNVSRETL